MSRFTIDLSEDIDSRLTLIARKKGISKAEAVRRAFALLSIADQEEDKGHSLGIIKEDPEAHEMQAVARIIGI